MKVNAAKKKSIIANLTRVWTEEYASLSLGTKWMLACFLIVISWDYTEVHSKSSCYWLAAVLPHCNDLLSMSTSITNVCLIEFFIKT